jgi:hypothetical protein
MERVAYWFIDYPINNLANTFTIPSYFMKPAVIHTLAKQPRGAAVKVGRCATVIVS